jgi:hypothetical protein
MRTKSQYQYPKGGLPKEVLEPVVRDSYGITRVALSLGISTHGLVTGLLGDLITSYGIDTSHFCRAPRRKWLDSDIFCIWKYFNEVSRGTVKARYQKKTGICTCEMCGYDPFGDLDPRKMELDHICGNTRDNRIENLRYICRKCHKETETNSRQKSSLIFDCDCCTTAPIGPQRTGPLQLDLF